MVRRVEEFEASVSGAAVDSDLAAVVALSTGLASAELSAVFGAASFFPSPPVADLLSCSAAFL